MRELLEYRENNFFEVNETDGKYTVTAKGYLKNKEVLDQVENALREAITDLTKDTTDKDKQMIISGKQLIGDISFTLVLTKETSSSLKQVLDISGPRKANH